MNKTYMNLDVTLQYAVEQLAAKDPVEISRNTDTLFDGEKNTFIVDYFGDKYFVSFPDGDIKPVKGGDDLSLKEKILIIHYLVNANGAPLENKWISFKELPDGSIYVAPFNSRAIQPMLRFFSDKPEKLIEAAQVKGGIKKDLGDASVTLQIFPRVPITYVIWAGDDEFPPSGNVLFDASAPNYLPTEDYAIMAQEVILALGKMSQEK